MDSILLTLVAGIVGVSAIAVIGTVSVVRMLGRTTQSALRANEHAMTQLLGAVVAESPQIRDTMSLEYARQGRPTPPSAPSAVPLPKPDGVEIIEQA